MELDTYLQSEIDENYCGFEPAYIDGQGIRQKGHRPKAVKEISKSVLTDIDELDENEEYYYDSFGTRRKRKKQVTELTDISVQELSFVDSPATRKTFSVIKSLDKGDEDNMEILEQDLREEKQDKGWEEIPANETTKIKEVIEILNKYDLSDDLKRASVILAKYFGGKPAEKVEKSIPKWNTVQRQIRGYSDEDIDNLDSEEVEEFSKARKGDKWPSLTSQFNLNKERISDYLDELNIEERFC